jgi:hypothetical protein
MRSDARVESGRRNGLLARGKKSEESCQKCALNSTNMGSGPRRSSSRTSKTKTQFCQTKVTTLVLAQNLKRRLSSCGRPERPRAFQSRETPRHSRGNKSEIAGNQMEQILEAYENALAEYNITDGDARLPLQRHITPVSLIDVRFGPKVQLKDSEIQDHDNSTYLPDCRLDLGQTHRQNRLRFNAEVFQ